MHGSRPHDTMKNTRFCFSRLSPELVQPSNLRSVGKTSSSVTMAGTCSASNTRSRGRTTDSDLKTTKSGKWRVVPILKAEREKKGERCYLDDLVFGWFTRSRRCTSASFARAAAPTFALLGHSSAAMTQRYAHLVPRAGDNVRSVFEGRASRRIDNGVTTETDSAPQSPAIPQ